LPKALKAIVYEHLDSDYESDINFLTVIVENH